MKMDEVREWLLQGGQYLGEISALCFLHLPSCHFSSLPYLLAGTGSQILLFDVNLGRLIKSFQVFDGIRVHGISSNFTNFKKTPISPLFAFKIAVFGEKRVKVLNLLLEVEQISQGHLIVSVDLTLCQLLPKFSHWVLDICFLKDGSASSQDGCHRLAVGCSDNSVHIWDMLRTTVILEVRSPERCLLYSMRLWGHEFEALLIASGTIYNEIVIWKMAHQHSSQSMMHSVKDLVNEFDNGHSSGSRQCEGDIICRLAGHQGSIFRISWSYDGSKLVSVSDDRCARIWFADAEAIGTGDLMTSPNPYFAGPVLFGHNARVWDCCIFDSVIVTAGEDCTCRVWGLDGEELKLMKEHIGRGIWRCFYDPNSSLLVTAGFDGAIKVHKFRSSSSVLSRKNVEEVDEIRNEVLKVSIPNSSGRAGLMDSKSEYVRCLRFTREDTLYVATNHGYVYQAKLSDSGSTRWAALVRVSEEVPIICMDLFTKNLPNLSTDVEDWVALGDGKGVMTVVNVSTNACTPKVGHVIKWSAEMERQLLGTYWCGSLGCRYVFTCDPRGMVKLWRLPDRLSHFTMETCDVCLVANFYSPFGARIMCLDASLEEEVLVCGDLRGNLVAFPLLESMLLDESHGSAEKMPSIGCFKGAHGISTVSSISIAKFSNNIIEICSTGGDGCICHLEYNKDRQSLEFVGMKRVKEVSLIESVSTSNDFHDNPTTSSYALGFSSADFLIWNLLSETKVVQVNCGGWRRPHSYYLGPIPEIKSCFAYVKDDIIYIHRYLVPDGQKIFPRNLHLQFHGREIHSLCFISEQFQHTANAEYSLGSKSCWIASGCEDGSVRLTRYVPGVENWWTSNLLGEHVGGSSVRSLCFVSKLHSMATNVVDMPNGTCGNNDTSTNNENFYLLISVGAKRVLTCWLQRNRQMSEWNASDVQPNECCSLKSEVRGSSSVSFKWLSTDMPAKCVHAHKKTQDDTKLVKLFKKGFGVEYEATSTQLHSDNKEIGIKQCGDLCDNDWRYLAVTAFIVTVADSRFTVCFVVVACSDATLTLRALVLPYRYWFDVASLIPLSSPVLALQHIVVPLQVPSQDSMQIKNIYIVISGSTDGSIVFWDLTASIEAFMQHISSFCLEKSIDFQKRPRTGRGSQGGRWWRSVDAAVAMKKKTHISTASNNEIYSSNNMQHGKSSQLIDSDNGATSFSDAIRKTSLESGASSDDSLLAVGEITPVLIMNQVHQSGVNCLHVCCQSSANDLLYTLVSGGDDQTLNFARFYLAPASTSLSLHDSRKDTDKISDSGISNDFMRYSPSRIYSIKFLYRNKVACAHSSAIKGIWTDGSWIFSTGLDQRVRCWKLTDHGLLNEHSHLVISVPEPEALDARACGRECYEIVVAGRGMQMVEFSASYGTDNGK